MMWWGFTKRCPRCGSGHLFRKWFNIVDECPRCGLHFDREPGYWTGALAINVGVTSAVFVLFFVVALAITIPEVPVAPLLAILDPADDHRPDRLLPVLEDGVDGVRPRRAPTHGPERGPRPTALIAADQPPRDRASRRADG